MLIFRWWFSTYVLFIVSQYSRWYVSCEKPPFWSAILLPCLSPPEGTRFWCERDVIQTVIHHEKTGYPSVIKHGVLENGQFISDFPRVPYSQVILASHNAIELLLLVTELGSPLAARLLEKNHNFWIFLMGESIINIYKLPFSKAILTLPEGTLLCLAHGMAKNRSTSTSGGPYVLRLTFVAFQAPFSLLPLLAGANSSDGLTWQRESTWWMREWECMILWWTHLTRWWMIVWDRMWNNHSSNFWIWAPQVSRIAR